MFQKRGPARGGRGRATYQGKARIQHRPRGLFEQGSWLCECQPRLAADHFRVRKEGPTQGRWFYTCQKPQDERCGFFLWDEDAEPRMQAALLHNANSEPDDQAGEQLDSHLEGNAALPAWEQPKPNQTASRKRTLPWKRYDEDDESDEELLPWPATQDDLPNPPSSTPPPAAPPSTPRKAAKTSAATSPGSRVREDNAVGPSNGLLTPKITPGKRRLSDIDYWPAEEQETPTPVRSHDALGPSPAKPGEHISPAVMTFLSSHGVQLQRNVAAGLRSILETHDQQVRGLAKGRDIAREAVKTRDARVAEMTSRIEALEGDLELYRARLKSLKE